MVNFNDVDKLLLENKDEKVVIVVGSEYVKIVSGPEFQFVGWVCMGVYNEIPVWGCSLTGAKEISIFPAGDFEEMLGESINPGVIQ